MTTDVQSCDRLLRAAQTTADLDKLRQLADFGHKLIEHCENRRVQLNALNEDAEQNSLVHPTPSTKRARMQMERGGGDPPPSSTAFVCHFATCGQTFYSSRAYHVHRHNSGHHARSDYKYECGGCFSWLSSAQTAREHLHRCPVRHTNPTMIPIRPEDDTETATGTDDSQNTATIEAASYWNKECDARGMWTCDVANCGKVFATRGQFRGHVNKVHSREPQGQNAPANGGGQTPTVETDADLNEESLFSGGQETSKSKAARLLFGLGVAVSFARS